MSYFDEVYLKRMNKDGRTQQERIQTRKENEFDHLILKKSQYQAKIYECNDAAADIVCTLQPTKKFNETQEICRLMTSKSAEVLNTGDILHIFQKIDNIEYNKNWLILFREENISRGYYCYRVVCLDRIIDIKNEYGTTLHTIPVKIANTSSEIIKDYFSSSVKNYGYTEPDMETRIITRNFDFLKKETIIDYNGQQFKIEGINSLSVENVAYISIKEKLKKEVEPTSSATIPVSDDTNFFLNNR